MWFSIILVRPFPAARGCQSYSRLSIWSRETGSAVRSSVSPLKVHTQAESGAYSRAPLLPPVFRDVVHLYGHSRDNQVTQLRADGVHRRELFVDKGPVVPKIARVTGALYSGIITPWIY